MSFGMKLYRVVRKLHCVIKQQLGKNDFRVAQAVSALRLSSLKKLNQIRYVQVSHK